VVNAIAHNHIETPRLTKQGFVAGGAAAVAVAGGLPKRGGGTSHIPYRSLSQAGVGAASTAGSRSGVTTGYGLRVAAGSGL